MSQNNLIDYKKPGAVDALTALIRNSARKAIAEAVEAELEIFLSEFEQSLSNGKSRFVRNGYLPEREIMTSLGKVKIQIPRIRDRSDSMKKITFKSSLIPPYMRRTATINEVLPLLYLKGISEADFQEALTPLFGEQAKNLSPSVISRLKMGWEREYMTWHSRDLGDSQYVYWWVDGVGFAVRDDDRRCVLVIIGVTPEGNKELIALVDGYRESEESWLEVLRDLKRKGIKSPLIAVGDGALGFWNAVTEVFPKTRHQRCWFHKMANVLDKLPKTQQAKAKSMLHEIWMAPTRKEAYRAFDVFIAEFKAKYPKATECLQKDREALLTFYDFPAEHWVHLRTTNPIESVFATVRHRTYKVKGAFSNKTILMMAFKLMNSAQRNWRRLRGFHHFDNVIKGVKFIDGKMEVLKNGKTEETIGVAA